MRDSIGAVGLIGIVIFLILLFTAYFCVSINYTSAYKVTDSINNVIKKDEGVNVDNIRDVLQEFHYTASGICNETNDDNWKSFLLDGSTPMSGKANYCLKKVKVAKNDEQQNLPDIYYYRIKVFYNIDVPIITNFNFNVKADSANIYSPNESDEGYVVLEAVSS